jgi:hypothetical protein
VSGRLKTPTGTVRIYRWNGSQCSGSGSIVGPYGLVGGEIDTTYYWPMTTLGSYAFRATYQGDATYNAFASKCVVVIVVKWPATFKTELHSRFETVITSAYVGDSVHAAATLSGDKGTPTGLVAVRHYPTAGCSGSPDADLTTPAAAVIDPAGPKFYGEEPGKMSWQLEYLGDGVYASATGPCMTMTFTSFPDVTATVHDASHDVITTLTAGKAAHVRATVVGIFGTPTGQVTIKWFANGTCTGGATTLGKGTLSNGVIDDAALDLVPSKAGTYSFMAFYGGNASYEPEISPCVVLKVVAAPVVTPKPTAAPTPTPTTAPTAKPTATSTTTQEVASATSAPATSSPSASEAPAATDQSAPSAAPDPTSAVSAASDEPSLSGAPAATDAAGTGSTATGPTSPSSDGGFAWIVLLLVLLLLIATFVIWAARRSAGQRRRAPEVSR